MTGLPLPDRPSSDVFDRDPCDGCDGTCGDVCPVWEAKRVNDERAAKYEALRVQADMHAKAEAALRMLSAFIARGEYEEDVTDLLFERDRLRAENGRLRKALTVAREAMGISHTIDPSHGEWKGEGEDIWFDYGDTHTENCGACEVERKIDAALDLAPASDETGETT